jgi:hypothetical protein
MFINNSTLIKKNENLTKVLIYILKDYHLIKGRRLVCLNDAECYAGRSVSSWKSHPCQTGQRVGGQTKLSPWSSRLVVGRGANGPTPEKHTVMNPPEK